MPREEIRDYLFTGPSRVVLYSEQEMAGEMAMTVEELRTALGGSRNRFSFHFFDKEIGEYIFNQSSFEDNILKRSCIMDHGDHDFQFDHYYDKRLKKACYKCSRCPAEKWD